MRGRGVGFEGAEETELANPWLTEYGVEHASHERCE